MVHSRWQIVIVSFLAGILIGICIAYSLSGGRRDFVWKSTQPMTKDESQPLSGGYTAVEQPVVQMPVLQKAQQTKSLKQITSYATHLSAASYTTVEDQYYNRISGVHVKCDVAPHIGRRGDGGWEVCMTPAFKPNAPCLVYTFGVNNIWEFDEQMARNYGCTVRAFDPSMSVNDHVHTPGPVHFYKIGLGGMDRSLSNGWKLFTFQSLLNRFGEANRTLDLVKIDIEYSEWEAFESMLATGVLQRTKQLLFETHTKDLNSVITSKKDYLRYHKILDDIEALGFRRFFRHDNPFGVGPVSSTRSRSSDPVYRKSVNLRRTCCHELYYVNMNFAKDMTNLKLV